jgi:hypothetical protein
MYRKVARGLAAPGTTGPERSNSPGDGGTSMSSQGTQRTWNRRDVLAAGCALAGMVGWGQITHAEASGSKIEDGKPENPIDDIKAGLAEVARAVAEARKA